jgi:hypothetical protein
MRWWTYPLKVPIFELKSLGKPGHHRETEIYRRTMGLS